MLELNRAGVGDDIRRLGFQPNGVSWRKLDGSVITKLSSEIFENDPTRIACLPLNRLGKVLSEHLKKYPQVDILFDHLVTGIGQDNEKAWVHANTPEGPKKIEADYIVGCDGANSQVRRSLFGDWEFPGKTWDRQIVATNASCTMALQLAHRTDQIRRFTMTLTSSSGMTRISSSIRSIISWPQRSLTTECGGFLMES
jgi:2-polyprenyl-6-methoxyphenol hydroxylase-like FAD-dependent oxidoreductase